MPKALEVEKRKIKQEVAEEEFKTMWKDMKKAPLSTPENQIVVVEDFVKALIAEARKLELLFQEIPKVKLPEESSDSSDEETEGGTKRPRAKELH